MDEIVLIRVTGEDKPGILHALTDVLAHHEVRILDIGQAVIHNTLSLGLIIHIPEEQSSAPVIKDVLFRAHELGVQLTFEPVSGEEHEAWVKEQGSRRYIVTLMAREVSSRQVERVSGVLSSHSMNIHSVTRLSGRISLANPEDAPRGCVEFTVRGEPQDPDAIRTEFMEISREEGVDIGFQEDNVYRRNRRLICFDMDSTLIQAEVIDELAREAGVMDKVAAITESAMRGELDFKQSLRHRVSYLEGLPVSVMDNVAERIQLTDGARRLFGNLRKLGYKVAILSGGFTYFGRKLQQELGIDYVHANELEMKDGKLTGRVDGEIVDGARKAALLQEIARKENLDLQQVVAVGDGANDLPMLHLAGLGIAFHAKPVVRRDARQSISTLGLDSILYLLGMSDREALE
ncbi:phosphoserine phosphatase SerB [Desulfobaculum bizertense]|uniref:Phosphoserine phosphatase n=1 Tax=Desulfobaculum bizertense DSM 18034 TaxID=1121442 RepID=A0A1T4VIH2_9BACT|nr:phosphoserine phosphatase SerB [Desulfobaculum bizertense]UIJ37910.1 phosphoserine phosphatase SerB [Desulfobaculum bizertense]SKA64713.1 phosphoserine phosphatase [Desulfobaculum bizertense DSM 18034]